jgi:hypothetical protein
MIGEQEVPRQAKRVLVLCPNVWDKEALARPSIQRDYELVFACEELLDMPSLWQGLRFDVFRLIRRLAATHKTSDFAGILGSRSGKNSAPRRGPHTRRNVAPSSHPNRNSRLERLLEKPEA